MMSRSSNSKFFVSDSQAFVFMIKTVYIINYFINIMSAKKSIKTKVV